MSAHRAHHVLVRGATGYIGRRLVEELVDAGHAVRCLARTPAKLDDERWRSTVDVVRGDVGDAESLAAAFEGIDTAYFLVHSIGTEPGWEEQDHRCALNVAAAAQAAGTQRIIYLGGLGDETAGDLSPHLASRHEVGRALASGSVGTTELRAAVVIGSGSASFEMLRHLVEVLPVMVTPKWVDTRCQPIAVRDVLHHLAAALEDDAPGNRVVEIGGPDVLTYREMMQIFAEEAGLRRRRVIPVPVLSPSLSSRWIRLVTPLPVDLARPLVDSLVNEVIVNDPTASSAVMGGDGTPYRSMSYRDAVRAALRRVADLNVATTWADAELYGRSPADPLPNDPDWAGGTLLEDRKQVTIAASPEDAFAIVEGIGGERGWFASGWMWHARGLLDQLAGGIGMRRGRRHPDHLRVGDALDFWRVELLERPRRLRLRAEMLLPGEAWLEWNIEPGPTADSCTLEQVARFVPRGLWGRAYWYAVLPFHGFVFGPMTVGIKQRAEQRAAEAVTGANARSPIQP